MVEICQDLELEWLTPPTLTAMMIIEFICDKNCVSLVILCTKECISCTNKLNQKQSRNSMNKHALLYCSTVPNIADLIFSSVTPDSVNDATRDHGPRTSSTTPWMSCQTMLCWRSADVVVTLLPHLGDVYLCTLYVYMYLYIQLYLNIIKYLHLYLYSCPAVYVITT